MSVICAVCHGTLVSSQHTDAAECGHVLHHGCWTKWLERKSTCPECRKKTTHKDLIRIFLTCSEDVPTEGSSDSLSSKFQNLELDPPPEGGCKYNGSPNLVLLSDESDLPPDSEEESGTETDEGSGSCTVSGNEETSGEEIDERETVQEEAGSEESCSEESCSEESGSEESDSEESGSEETDSEETDSEETDSEETDSEETVSAETDCGETCSWETGSEGEVADSEETDSEETDSEETDSEETDSEETDSGESGSDN